MCLYVYAIFCFYSEKIAISLRDPLHGSTGVLDDAEGVLFDGVMSRKLESILRAMMTPTSRKRVDGDEPPAIICFGMNAAQVRKAWVTFLKDMFFNATKAAVPIAVNKAQHFMVYDGYVNVVAFELHRALFRDRTYMMYVQTIGVSNIIRFPSVAG